MKKQNGKKCWKKPFIIGKKGVWDACNNGNVKEAKHLAQVVGEDYIDCKIN